MDGPWRGRTAGPAPFRGQSPPRIDLVFLVSWPLPARVLVCAAALTAEGHSKHAGMDAGSLYWLRSSLLLLCKKVLE